MIKEKDNTPLLKMALLIAPVNALANITVNYYPVATINPGTIRAGLILLFLLYFITRGIKENKLNLLILTSLLYWGILAYFTSDPGNTLYLYMRLFISFMMLPVGYFIFTTKQRLKSLTKSYIVALLLIVADITLANIFGYGTSDYIADTFYFGAGRVNITKPAVVLVFIAPIAFMLIDRKYRFWLGALFVYGLIISLIGIKRSVLVSVIVAVVLYLFLSPFRSKLIKSSIILYILLISVFSYFVDVFILRFDARGERIFVTEETIEEEARYNEYFEVTERWINGNLKHKLTGSEFLNDRELYSTDRMLHTDYMILLSGSGLIGVFLWFLILISIVKKKNKYYYYIKSDKFFRELNTVFWIIFSAQLIISISGTIYDVALRSFIFLYLGAIIGVMRSEAINRYLLHVNGSSSESKEAE